MPYGNYKAITVDEEVYRLLTIKANLNNKNLNDILREMLGLAPKRKWVRTKQAT